MSGMYIDIVKPQDDQIAKLKRDNVALLAACKSLRRWVDGPTAEEDFPRLAVVKLQADKAIAEAES